MDWTTLVVPTLTASASFLGAWLATRFALRRFYSEKLWERKTIAYTAIFEGLHDMGLWFDRHLTAEMRGQEVDQDTAKQLTESYQKAKAVLFRRLDSETWLIPTECRELLERLVRTLSKRGEGWIDMLEVGQAAIEDAIKELRELVRADLNLDRRTFYVNLYNRFITLLKRFVLP
jgi:hypothetical protein